MSKIILLSGGMDSFISWRVFAERRYYTPIFIRNLSCYSSLDFSCALELLNSTLGNSLHVLTAPKLEEHPNGHVPYRNALLLSYVANQFEPEEIMISAPRGELIYDQQSSYYKNIQKILPGIRITNPLEKLTKAQAIKLYCNAGGKLNELYKTRSCYSSTVRQCGNCSACLKRYIAFKINKQYPGFTMNIRKYYNNNKNKLNLRTVAQYGLRPTLEALRVYYDV